MSKIIIEDILSSKKKWKTEFDEKYDFIKKHIGEDDCFNKSVKFKFKESDKLSHSMLIADYIVNLILWRPFIKFKRDIDHAMIFDCRCITSRSLKQYIDDQIVKKYTTKYPMKLINLECAKIIEKSKTILEDFGLIMAMSLDLFDTLDLMEKRPDYADIIYTDLPPQLQPAEIESYIKERSNKMVEILTTEENQYKPFLLSREGIKIDQLNEYQLSEGNKPDLCGNTYDKPINTNLLGRGLDCPSHYALDAAGGRKAQIMNKKYTGESGYFARQLDYLCMDLTLNDKVDDCKTKTLTKIKVRNSDTLTLLRGLYYCKKKNSKVLRMIDPDKDTHLIGDKIYIRSPLTCACKKGICKKCYGYMSKINNDIHIGLFAAKEISSKFTQRVLSAKHLLKTNSMKLVMSKIFDEYFILVGGSVMINPYSENKFTKTYIQINCSNIRLDNFYDVEDEDMKIRSFKIVHKNEVLGTVKEEKYTDLCITEYLFDLLKHYASGDREVQIPLNKIDDNETLFTMSVMNHELTKPLRDLENLMNSADHLDCESIDELANKLIELFVSIGFDTLAVHGMLLLRNIVRSVDDESKLPNYKNEIREEDVQFITVKRADKINNSVLMSLSFERMNEQLRSPKTFRKTQSSMIDALFKIRS